MEEFLNYHRLDGDEVFVFEFVTTKEEERRIMERIDERGGGRPFTCAVSTSSVLDGVGPFKDLGVFRTPAGLKRRLSKIIGLN